MLTDDDDREPFGVPVNIAVDDSGEPYTLPVDPCRMSAGTSPRVAGHRWC
jgi:hypothetical protein